MIQVFSIQSGQRKKYALKLILTEILGLSFEIVSDKKKFMQSKLPGFEYNPVQLLSRSLFLSQHPLLTDNQALSRTNLPEKNEINRLDNIPFFYAGTSTSFFPFDIFSAAFLLVSRYEEYLPFEKDSYGRFTADKSFIFQLGFLHLPLVNLWAEKFGNTLKKHFPCLKFKKQNYRHNATIDVDNAFAIQHKNFLRSTGGIMRSVLNFDWNDFILRIRVLGNKRKDPFDTYDFIKKLHKKYKAKTCFFFLLGDYNKYDKACHYKNQAFQKLIQEINKLYPVGIHPSFASNKNKKSYKKEIRRLEKITGQQIKMSRQHYLILEFPTTYRRLISNNISEDYSMGYASHPGYRASIATCFNFYDLLLEKETNLRIFPFQVMDGTFKNYLKLDPNRSITVCMNFIRLCKKHQLPFTSLWHNESLSDYKSWKGWKQFYERLCQMANSETT